MWPKNGNALGLNEQEHLPLRKGPGWFQLCHLAGQPIANSSDVDWFWGVVPKYHYIWLPLGCSEIHILIENIHLYPVRGDLRAINRFGMLCCIKNWIVWIISCSVGSATAILLRKIATQWKLDDDICRNPPRSSKRAVLVRPWGSVTLTCIYIYIQIYVLYIYIYIVNFHMSRPSLFRSSTIKSWTYCHCIRWLPNAHM